MFRVGADGLAAGQPVRVASRSGLHGIAFSKGKVYLAAVHEIFKADVRPDGTFGPLDMIIHDLPDAGQHNTRTVQIGPDDMMYISIGSTCNECTEPNPENATILRASLDGKSRSIFASGLRDTVGWGWQPQTGELWGMDNGIDALGDNLQPEELNHIEKGKRYGWPYLFGENQPNPHLDPPGGLQKSELAKTNVPMALGYTAHAAPMQMAFYNAAQFPSEYQGDAFVSMRGSWNRKPPSGYEVVRIHFKNGQPVSIEPFVTGFVTSQGEYGRPAGNAIAQDGSLLFTDDRNGVIYRVSYTGNGSHSQTQTISGESMRHQARIGRKVGSRDTSPGDRNECVPDRLLHCVRAGRRDSSPVFFLRSEREPAASLDGRTQRHPILRDSDRGPRCHDNTTASRSLGGLEYSRHGDRIAGRTRESGPSGRSHGTPPGAEYGRR